MADERTERRLAAILAADVAGYSRLMGADEVGTLAALKAHRREVIDPAITRHKGRIVKTTGDGMLVEFASAVDAVTCAMAVQSQMGERGGDEASKITFRIGINVGDIIIDGDDIFGDGVNVAARVENECTPGGVCLSDDAYRQVRGKTAFAFDDLGEKSLKNIERPVRLFSVRPGGSTPILGAAQFPDKPLPLPDKPSIAVLPFQNMSGDPEQEYFADGMVEDIITELSRFQALFVIARNSTFTYKGKAVDIKTVGRELGVRYILEGSVRKSGRRIRITGQLIDAATGAHLWADKFEGDLEVAFDLQDKITVSVVGAIAPRLVEAEVERVKRKPPERWDAYDYYLKGLALYAQRNLEANDKALPLFRKAIELNSEFGLAYMRAAACLFQRPAYGAGSLTPEQRADVIALNDRALALEPKDAFVVAWAALIIAFTANDLERGSDYADQALNLNPNFSNAWNARGWISLCLGDASRSLEAFDHAIRLNPLDDWTVFIAMRGRCGALWALDRHADMLEQTRKLIARAPNDLHAWFYRWVVEEDPTIQTRFPELRKSDLKRQFSQPARNPERRARLEESINRLDLPE
ncbi:MAG: adenylate/guanylate cyclase domain-containing protein [Bradyrhizobium sp.]